MQKITGFDCCMIPSNSTRRRRRRRRIWGNEGEKILVSVSNDVINDQNDVMIVTHTSSLNSTSPETDQSGVRTQQLLAILIVKALTQTVVARASAITDLLRRPSDRPSASKSLITVLEVGDGPSEESGKHPERHC